VDEGLGPTSDSHSWHQEGNLAINIAANDPPGLWDNQLSQNYLENGVKQLVGWLGGWLA